MTQQNNNSFMTFPGQPGCACTKNNPSSHAVNIVMPRPYEQGALSDNARLTTYVVCLTSVAYIVNIHGAHSYWKQGALGAAGVRDGLQLGRRVRRTAGGGHIVSPRAQLVIVQGHHGWAAKNHGLSI